MQQKKQVVFIGGVNGSGKTSLIGAFSERFGYLVRKQKRTMIEVGTEKGIPWKEIPHHYEELIGETAERITQEFLKAETSVMLIDCHYAFKLKKALAVNLEEEVIETDESFLQAIDDRVIEELSKEFLFRLVFLEVRPEIALSRTSERLKNVADGSYTKDTLSKNQEAEKKFFKKILRKFDIPQEHAIVLPNNEDIETAIKEIKEFIHSG